MLTMMVLRCDILACFNCLPLAAAEQVQSKIVLLDGNHLHFDWCLFGASDKDVADLKTGTDLEFHLMGTPFLVQRFVFLVTVEDPSVIVLSNRTSLPSLGTPLLIWRWHIFVTDCLVVCVVYTKHNKRLECLSICISSSWISVTG